MTSSDGSVPPLAEARRGGRSGEAASLCLPFARGWSVHSSWEAQRPTYLHRPAATDCSLSTVASGRRRGAEDSLTTESPADGMQPRESVGNMPPPVVPPRLRRWPRTSDADLTAPSGPGERRPSQANSTIACRSSRDNSLRREPTYPARRARVLGWMPDLTSTRWRPDSHVIGKGRTFGPVAPGREHGWTISTAAARIAPIAVVSASAGTSEPIGRLVPVHIAPIAARVAGRR